MYIISGIVCAFLLLIIAVGYTKAAPDVAIIISGLRRKRKVLIGKAGVRIPFLERKDVLDLRLIPIDVKTSTAVPTADYINILVDAVVNIKVSDDPDKLECAAQNFLNKKAEDIGAVAREVLEGNMREIVGKMTLREMVNDRQKFAELVKENANPDLASMGLDIISFNVQNFVDKNEVIENLGIDNIVQIKKQAAISRAESEKDIATAQAQSKSLANEAEVKAQQEIAERENKLEIKKAELKKEADAKKAEADAAYRIQEQSQRKSIETATVAADIAKQEQSITLKTKEAEVVEQSLNAEIRKKAEAEKFAAQQKADATLYMRQKDAEARRYENEQEAEARKAQAEAEKYALEQEAEGIKAKGEAEAAAIKARGEAEAAAIKAKALGEAEGIDKKADAMKKMGEAAIAEMYFNALPGVARSIAEPLSKVEKIIMYGDGNTTKMMKDIVQTANQVFDGASEAVGIDVKSLVAGFLGGKIANSAEKNNSDNQEGGNG